MEPPHGAVGGLHPAGARGAEAPLAGVVDEGGVVEDVEEPRLQGAEAELALLAIAEPEALLVEQPQPVERLPLDVEADADAGGQARALPGARPARPGRRSGPRSSRRAGR